MWRLGEEEELLMKLVLLALITGVIAGGIFTLFKLPLPAPPTVAGIAGIFGIFAGAKLAEFVMQMI